MCSSGVLLEYLLPLHISNKTLKKKVYLGYRKKKPIRVFTSVVTFGGKPNSKSANLGGRREGGKSCRQEE